MATGGTGDVLAGICGALLAQKLSLAHAAVASVYVHGLAADIEAARRGQAGLLASDLWEGLCAVWSRWNL
jgi:NAD(P)H-hydrate epimerase